MNNYPVWWDDTITVYNKYVDQQTMIITWFRHVLHNVFLKRTGNKVIINNVELETDGIICRIPQNDAFLPKYVWVQIPNDRMANYFTLAPGDIIVFGEVEDTIDEYIAGHRSNDLKAKYKELQGCMEIQDMSVNVGLGRNEQHYYVRGI